MRINLLNLQNLRQKLTLADFADLADSSLFNSEKHVLSTQRLRHNSLLHYEPV